MSEMRAAGEPTRAYSSAMPDALPRLQCPAGKWWACALLGAVFIVSGAFILYHVVVASVVGALFFAGAMIVAGGFQIFHAFSARGWGSLALSMLIGILFVVGGLLLAINPLATSLGITLGFAAILLTTGVIRSMLAFRHWNDQGWVLLVSGVIAIGTGVVIILGFPWSGFVVPGLLIGLDFLFHGVWWVAVGAFIRRPGTPAASQRSVASPSV